MYQSKSRRLINIGFVFAVVLLALGMAGNRLNVQAQSTTVATEAATQGHVFVGPVEDSKAFIGLAVSDGKFTAFVCDGTEDWLSYWHWFTGKAQGQSIEFTAEDGESFTAQITGDTVSGSVTLGDKKVHPFKADLATGSAGLFRAEFTLDGVEHIGGWIVLPNNQVRGGVADKRASNKPTPASFINSARLLPDAELIPLNH